MKLILTLLLFATLSCASAPTEPKCNHDPRVRCCGLIPEAECAHIQAGKTYTLEELAGMLEIRRQAQEQGHVWLERIKQNEAKRVQPETTIIVVKVQVEYPKEEKQELSEWVYPIGRGIIFDDGGGTGSASADSMWDSSRLHPIGIMQNRDSTLLDSILRNPFTLELRDTAAPL